MRRMNSLLIPCAPAKNSLRVRGKFPAPARLSGQKGSGYQWVRRDSSHSQQKNSLFAGNLVAETPGVRTGSARPLTASAAFGR